MARKVGQGKEEEESRARQQKEKTPVRDEEKTPACDGRGHHVVEQGILSRNSGKVDLGSSYLVSTEVVMGKMPVGLWSFEGWVVLKFQDGLLTYLTDDLND
ncbi:hypothetical protein STEG23_017446 [Scotinomys teguina]